MTESKQKYFQKALDWANSRSISELKANHEDFDPPKSFVNKSTDQSVQADMSFKLNGKTRYFSEIALKTEKVQSLVTKWKLLSMMASMKGGKLFLLAPKGHKMFTEKIVERYNINAIIYSLS